MRKLLKYKLKDGRIPAFIENGGYFPQEDGSLIGVSIVLDDAEVPAGAVWLKESDLQAIITAANANLPEGQEPMTVSKFEADKFMYHYESLIHEQRITAIENFIMG